MTAFANGVGPGQQLQPGTTLMLPYPVGEAKGTASAGAPGQSGGSVGQPGSDSYAGTGKKGPGATQTPALSREDFDQGTSAATRAKKVDATWVDGVRKDVKGLIQSFEHSQTNPESSWATANRLPGVMKDLSSMQPAEFKHLVNQLDQKDLGHLLELAQKQSPEMLRKIEQLAVQTDKPTVEPSLSDPETERR